MIEIRCVAETADQLGESPLWSERDGTLYWLDNTKPMLHRYRPSDGDLKSWSMTEEVGAIGLRAKGGFVAGMKSGFGFVDLPSGRLETIARPEGDLADNRMNDGKCDRRGRFWCGSMNVRFSENYQATASLYRFDPDGTCQRMESDIIVTNGIAFSPDDRTMYLSDSSGKTVWVYDFDLDDGALSNRREFISSHNLPGHSGKVDGATVDTDGCYWAAVVYDGLLVRYTPQGRVDRVYRMPVSNPTMPTFGGTRLDTMYITSTTKMLNGWQKQTQAMEGGLLEITGLGVQGLPEPEFAG
jgi:L-arabinonolactonase